MARTSIVLLAWVTLGLAGCEFVPAPALEPGSQPHPNVEVEAVEDMAPGPASVDDAVTEASEVVEPASRLRPGTPLVREGDEIMVAGQLFHTGTPVVLWTDPGGYDGYRVERRFSSWAEADWEHSQKAQPSLSTPNRYGVRAAVLSAAELERVRGGGWDLPLLQRVVDQFVLHYDASGTSRRCFERLHDHRGLSIHFMLDVDGTIYQTLDLKERAWHATVANSRSIGIEIANMGAYASPTAKELMPWYALQDDGQVKLTIPADAYPDSLRNSAAELRPDRNQLVAGPIRGQTLYQYDLTPAQYRALVQLTATLCTVFPRIACEVPRDVEGRVSTETLAPEAWRDFHGVLGHFHIQSNKIDPGPALQWDRVIREAKALMEVPVTSERGPSNP